jgi:hypothetical protein
MLDVIHGVNPRPAAPHSEELGKYEEDNSQWKNNEKEVAHTEQVLGNEPWMRSTHALLGPKPTFAVHDDGSRTSISTSIISSQDQPQSALEAASPAISNSNHFGPSKGIPTNARDSFSASSVPQQLQRMNFPDPVKVDSSMRMSDYDLKISPLSLPQRPRSGNSTPNFSRPSSRGGDPQFPLPDQTDFYRHATRSQSSLRASSVLSEHSASGQTLNGRLKTAHLSRPEEELTALPPVPPKDVRKTQMGWI